MQKVWTQFISLTGEQQEEMIEKLEHCMKNSNAKNKEISIERILYNVFLFNLFY